MEKIMFFVIPEMPSKTFVMLQKKLPGHFKLKQDKEVGQNSADDGDKGGFVHREVVEGRERGLLLYLRKR